MSLPWSKNHLPDPAIYAAQDYSRVAAFEVDPLNKYLIGDPSHITHPPFLLRNLQLYTKVLEVSRACNSYLI